MTLIATFLSEGRYPILVGDLLLSGPESTRRPTNIPTIGFADTVFPPGSGYTPVGLNQKIAIISDHCALAWSGRAIAAAYVFRELRRLAGTTRITRDVVISTLDEAKSHLSKLELTLVGCTIEEDNSVLMFEFGAEAIETPALGTMFVAGSGIDTLREHLRQPHGGGLTEGPTHPLYAAVAQGFSLTGALLELEVTSSHPLLHYFGGGYELATIVGGRFEKVGDTTYIFWHVTEDSDGGGIGIDNPTCVLHQHYIDDLLAIQAVRVDTVDRRFVIRHQARHAITPVYRTISEQERTQKVEWPNYIGARVCHSFLVSLRNGVKLVLVASAFPSPAAQEKSVRVDPTETGLRFEVSKAFVHSVAQEIMRAIKSQPRN